MCGYCAGPLSKQPDGTFTCERCKPYLAEIQTTDDWIRFHKAARRNPFRDRPDA